MSNEKDASEVSHASDGSADFSRRTIIGTFVAGFTLLFASRTTHTVVDLKAKGNLHDLKIDPPQNFTGQIAVQGEDTKTSVYVFRNGTIIRQHTIPEIHCPRLAYLGSPRIRSSQV